MVSNIQVLPSAYEQVIVQADFPAVTPQVLFDYFTQADLLLKWWAQQAEVDSKLGGAYYLAWPKAERHLRGVFTAFEPGEKLAFTWNWDHEPTLPERTVAFDFQPTADGTRLTVTHGSYDDLSPADADDRQSHIDGWLYYLDQLQQKLNT